jgi:hypothetical protein
MEVLQSGQVAHANHAAAPEGGAAPLLRRGVLIVAGVTCLGLLVELAVERHWTQPVQLVAWAALAATLVAAGLVWAAGSSARIRLARVLAVVVIVCAVVGMGEHIVANYDAGELDAEYGDRWSNLSAPQRWWLAISKGVGPSPPLAPGALAEAAALVLLATLRHPAARGAAARTEAARQDD